MSFDDDAAGEGAGFRPPPHPDDRLWRHPSELAGSRQVGLAPQPRHPWPWGIVAVVGTATVLMAGAGALVLGFRDTGGGNEVTADDVGTTVAIAPAVPPKSWLGIEGYDEITELGDGDSETATLDDADPTATSASTTAAPSDDMSNDDDPATEAGDTADDGATATGGGQTTTTAATAGGPGVMVATVDPEGPVADMLQPGDVVLAVDGQPVADMDELVAALQTYQPGDQVEITYIPAGGDPDDPVKVTVTLAERPESLSSQAQASEPADDAP